jgi:hypothetical protein
MYDKSKNQNLHCNLKYKHLQKELQMIQNFPQFFLQAYANVKCILQAYAKKIPFFPIAKELHHLHNRRGKYLTMAQTT